MLAENGDILIRAGDFSGMEWAPSLLGPQAYSLLDGAIRPAMSGQGREFALLDRAGSHLVIVFGLDRAQGMEYLAFARQVGESIEWAFSR
ncbi:MAG: hypothetical protein KF760_23660 [Candidatus Eremiobacteraeota bacterium]|nr:hypothetical protein [Candidatus Eremiobacteraeota bacterium]MCW5866222.1 hypothetical protein [Candidatus Eremiobacteraeota bacterium]